VQRNKTKGGRAFTSVITNEIKFLEFREAPEREKVGAFWQLIGSFAPYK